MERDAPQQAADVRTEATSVDIGERLRRSPWHRLVRLSVRAEVLVGAGAVLGVLGRWEAGNLARQHLPASFPFGTLIVNLAGCLLIGIVQSLFLDLSAMRRGTQLFLAVGLCGGFTTFSTFSVETMQLIEAGHIRRAIVYQGLSLAGGFSMVLVGMMLAQVAHRRIGLRRSW